MMEAVSRRSFFAGACAVAAISVVGLPAEAQGAVTKRRDGRLSIRVRDIAALKEVGSSARVGVFKGRPVALARTGPSTFIAFALNCPHQGVTVVKDESGWVCNAHGSKFESNGSLVLGPATAALPRVRAKFSKGVVVVG